MMLGLFFYPLLVVIVLSLFSPPYCCLGLSSSSSSSLSSSSSSQIKDVRFRCGKPDDEPIIAFTMAKELMNPLGISHKNFVVAEDITTGKRLGWAQIRPLGPFGVDPAVYDSSPGSISAQTTTPEDSMESDIDDMIWDEFDDDTTVDFPNFWSTLPWSKEYRLAMSSAKERRERRDQMVVEEQKKIERQPPSPQIWELASVYVIPERRSEGIGRNIVRSILLQHRQLRRNNRGGSAQKEGRRAGGCEGGDDVYALTLSRTVDWYSSLGFAVAEGIPKPMEFEVAAGNVLTKLMGNQLVCLHLPFDQIEEEEQDRK